jgi:transposase InsO family protein
MADFWRDGVFRRDINDAMRTIEAWRIKHNAFRPHSALGDLSPEDFAARHNEEKRVTLRVLL